MSDKTSATEAGDEPWESAQHRRALAIVWPLLGRHVAFHRRLVDLTASVKAALLLSQTIYWTRHGRDIVRTGGWFHKTSEQWEMETGLSAREQASARDALRALMILHEQRTGIPAKLHFRLCIDHLGSLLTEQISQASAPANWDDGVAIAQLLGPSLAYHRTLAGIGGGVHAGLLLSRALHLTRLQSTRHLPDWIGNSAAEWTHQIGLTRREQESARRDLARAGVWEETRAGIPPRRVVRIRLDCLLALLAGNESGPVDMFPVPRIPECGVAANRLAPNVESRVRESHSPASTKAPSLSRQNRHHCFDETAIHHIKGSTSVSVQRLRVNDAQAEERGSRGGGDLILPEGLLPEERASAVVLVQRCAGQAQALLDELSARMQANAVRTSPIAYLRGMVMRATTGAFVPELGPRVAAARRKRQEELIQREQREVEQRRLAAERASPDYQARIAVHRTELHRMLEGLHPGRQRGKRS